MSEHPTENATETDGSSKFPTEIPTGCCRRKFRRNSVAIRQKKMGISRRASSARAFRFWGGGVLAGYIILERGGVREREEEGRERK